MSVNLNTQQYGYYDPYNQYATNPYGAQQTTTYGTVPYGQSTTPVLTQAQPQTSAVSESGNTSTDGKDDGKIGFWSGVGSFFKGIGKAVVNTVKGILTDPKKLLMTVAAVAVSIAFPPAGVALAVAGGVMGAVGIGKGIHKAATAKTDAEKKDAFENIGAGTLQVGLSALGARAGLKAMGNTSGSAMAAAKSAVTRNAAGKVQINPGNLAEVAKAFGKDAVTGGRGNSEFLTSGFTRANVGKVWTEGFKGNTGGASGYLGTQGINNIAQNWNKTDGPWYSRAWETAKTTKTQAGDAMKEAKLTRQAAKDAKELDKAQKAADKAQKAADAADDANRARLQEAADGAAKKIDKLNQKILDKYTKDLKGAEKTLTETLDDLRAAREANKVEPGKFSEEQIKGLETKFQNASKAATGQRRIFADRADAYKTASADYANHQAKVDALKAEVKRIKAIKNPSETTLDYLKDIKTMSAQSKYNAPQTSMGGQALHGANNAAARAGYGTVDAAGNVVVSHTGFGALAKASTPALANGLEPANNGQVQYMQAPGTNPYAVSGAYGTEINYGDIYANAQYAQNQAAAFSNPYSYLA